MNKNIIFKGVVSALFLLLAACAPTIDGAKSLISGNAKAEYMSSATEIIAAIEEMAINIQPTNYHTPFFVQAKTANTMLLLAKPLSGSAVSASLAARGASKIEIKITLENRGGYTHLIFSPNPSSDEARAAQEIFIEKLDKKFPRYNESSLNNISLI
ncbi:MAG TPA: hypothetical protein ENK21_10400 [Trueperaceae bacterium]|nr:hypothetical protein [Trueperaceae bacterium]